MIAREWKCCCPKRHAQGFLDYLDQTGVKDTSATPGCLGGQVMTRELGGWVEIVLVTYWIDYESIKSYAGEDIHVARLYPEDAKYELEPDRHVTHYEVTSAMFPER